MHTWGCITWYPPSEWIEPLLLKVLSLCLSPLWVVHQPQGTRSCVRLPSNSVSSLWWWTATLSVCVRVWLHCVHLYQRGNSPPHLIGFLYFVSIDGFEDDRFHIDIVLTPLFKFARGVCVHVRSADPWPQQPKWLMSVKRTDDSPNPCPTVFRCKGIVGNSCHFLV